MIRLALKAILSAMLLTGGLSACNTMEGLGKDIKQAGQSLENAAERRK